jgi:single-strand DNA-binding protein
MMQNIFVNEGNLGSNPVLNYVPVAKGNGTESKAVVEFDIYCSVQKLNKKNEYEDLGGFWAKIQCWGKRAEYLNKHLKKGCRVLVVGEYAQHWYTASKGAKAGQEVANNEIIASHIGLVMLGVESIIFENRKEKMATDSTSNSGSMPNAGTVPEDQPRARMTADNTLQH